MSDKVAIHPVVLVSALIALVVCVILNAQCDLSDLEQEIAFGLAFWVIDKFMPYQRK